MFDDLATLLADGPVTLTLPSSAIARTAVLTLRPGLEAVGIRARFTRAANTLTMEVI